MGSTKSGVKKNKVKATHFISWFEIPAINFERSLAFYNAIFGITMETQSSNDYTMAFFPVDQGIGGAIVAGPGSAPGELGPLVYLNGGVDLSMVLDKVEGAGGRVVMSKTLINKDSGYFAIFIDTEGNKLALHSQK